MSILSIPTFSSAPISYWVIITSSPPADWPAPLVGAVQTGTYSGSGPGAMTTPGGVHRQVARDALDARAQVHQPAVDRVALHQVPQLVAPSSRPRGC